VFHTVVTIVAASDGRLLRRHGWLNAGFVIKALTSKQLLISRFPHKGNLHGEAPVVAQAKSVSRGQPRSARDLHPDGLPGRDAWSWAALTREFMRPAGWRRYRPPFRGKAALAELERVNSVLRGLAETHGRTPAQVALRWLVQQPGVIPIPGAKNGRQAAENAEALSFELSDQEMRALSG
jgi:hypothetical protein